MDTANFQFASTQGPVFAYIAEAGVQALLLPHPDRPLHPRWLDHTPNEPLSHALHALLDRYFQGQSVDFDAIPLDLSRGTAFQQQVWTAARAVGWGQTSTYAGLAHALGRERSSARAIGAALGANPVHILVPCHRYIAANGGLVDYAAGLAWKSRLLELEGALLA